MYIHFFILHVLKPTSTKKADKNQSWLPILGAYSIWSMVSRISRVVIVSYSVLLVQANVLVGAYSFAVPAMQTMHFSSLFFKLFTNNVCLLSLILFWILYRDPQTAEYGQVYFNGHSHDFYQKWFSDFNHYNAMPQ